MWPAYLVIVLSSTQTRIDGTARVRRCNTIVVIYLAAVTVLL
ncbi:MAG TPA: hypothetical protein VFY56_02030 [Propionibacteriaceae bacterium]|nr:hypothetical protein [Propionibacteriaceae bacterium]